MALIPAPRQLGGRRSSAAAFTLIELLVVLGVIGLVIGGLAVALRPGGSGAGLQAGQASLASLVAAARGQAALNQQRTTLAIWVGTPGRSAADNAADDRFMRGIYLLRDVSPAQDGTSWHIVGDPILLPPGIYLVPGGTAVSGGPLPTGLELKTGWDADRRSSQLSSLAPLVLPLDLPLDGQPSVQAYRTETLSPIGTMSGAGKIVLTSGTRRGRSDLFLSDDNNLRGLSLSIYGIATLIDEAVGFE